MNTKLDKFSLKNLNISDAIKIKGLYLCYNASVPEFIGYEWQNILKQYFYINIISHRYAFLTRPIFSGVVFNNFNETLIKINPDISFPEGELKFEGFTMNMFCYNVTADSQNYFINEILKCLGMIDASSILDGDRA